MADNPNLLDSLLEDIENVVSSERDQKESTFKHIPQPPLSDKHQLKINPKNKFAVLPSSSNGIANNTHYSISNQGSQEQRLSYSQTQQSSSVSMRNSFASANSNSRDATPPAMPGDKDDCVDDAALDSLLKMIDDNSSPSKSSSCVVSRTSESAVSSSSSPSFPSLRDTSCNARANPILTNSRPGSGDRGRYQQQSQQGRQAQQQDTDSSFDSLMQDLDASLSSPTKPTEAQSAPFTPPIRASSSATGTKTRCSRVVVAGTSITRGAKTSAFSKVACDNLRCLQCNFEVMQFPERGWDVGVDYMFFRNNVPNAQKLSSQLRVQSQSIAYCCQCSWLSAECEVVLSPGTPNQPQWVCAGH
eukprot:CAMPEP_0185026510 /NCGR_PEP_ID=MMETSP1103-20130426/10821_1 /TAXON_ID=36769 /ORGANISM="Paraphysomonas bandaiensis, Strain Caron Lab Isolate" /LENGTH=358 /DNA_ID=CAMNT_0027560119 /DNA_START=187 /DNA_END=1263 /DNA_ORIENTATION=+